MASERIEALTSLLSEAGAAHGRYEESELNGVYDQDWPAWYAAYAVEYRIGALIGRDITTDELAGYLARTNAELEQIVPKPTESWAAYTARRIATEL